MASSANPVVVPELAVGRHGRHKGRLSGIPASLQRACQRVMDSGGRQTHQHLDSTGPFLTNDRSPTFTLGANKGDCSYNYSLDGGPVLVQEAATTGSLLRSG